MPKTTKEIIDNAEWYPHNIRYKEWEDGKLWYSEEEYKDLEKAFNIALEENNRLRDLLKDNKNKEWVSVESILPLVKQICNNSEGEFGVELFNELGGEE